MKKLLILLFSIAILSCSKDNDNQPLNFNSQNLIGRWDLKSRVTGTTVDTLNSCEELHSGYEFKTNLTCIEGYGRFNINNCTNNQYNQTYSFTNNLLTVRQTNGYEARYNILELSTTKLKMTLTYSKEVNNGAVYEYNPTVNEQQTTSYVKM
jgi:hypothetical protein